MRAARRSPPVSRRTLLRGTLGVALVSASARVVRAATEPLPPVLYVSHGSPLFLPGNDARVAELKACGAQLAKPLGVLVMTPHYGTRHLELGRTGRGFAMYDLPPQIKRLLPSNLDYATPPAEAIATRVENLLAGTWPVARSDRRGFDHTTWMPMKCLFPRADVPVLEISYPYLRDAELFALGQRLAPLRDEGILFLGSGQMTHNLASIEWGSDAPSPSWSREFDVWAKEAISKLNVDALVDWRNKAPASEVAHPDDGGHYRMLLVALGVALGAAHAAPKVRFPVTGFEGTLSKRCVEMC
jgi:4,5-DOPA dioxygenase extradiol